MLQTINQRYAAQNAAQTTCRQNDKSVAPPVRERRFSRLWFAIAPLALIVAFSVLYLTPGAKAEQVANPNLPDPVSYMVKTDVYNSSTFDVFPYTSAAQAYAEDQALKDLDNATSYTNTYPTANVLPGDIITWPGIFANTQNPTSPPDVNGGNHSAYQAGWVGIWSPAGQFITTFASSGPTPMLDYDQDTTTCGVSTLPNSAPDTTWHPDTWWNRWCMGPTIFHVTVTTAMPGEPGFTDFGYIHIATVTVDPVTGVFAGKYSGPENTSDGVNSSTAANYNVIYPEIKLVKQVCAVYGPDGLPTCDPNDDPATVDMANQVDTNGPWVDVREIPAGAAQVEWRLTAFNTGNIKLSDVKVSLDELSGETAEVTGANSCTSQTFPDLSTTFDATLAGDTSDRASVTCTTYLTGNLSDYLVNTAQVDSTFDNTILDPNDAPLVNRFPNGRVTSNIDDAKVNEPFVPTPTPPAPTVAPEEVQDPIPVTLAIPNTGIFPTFLSNRL